MLDLANIELNKSREHTAKSKESRNSELEKLYKIQHNI